MPIGGLLSTLLSEKRVLSTLTLSLERLGICLERVCGIGNHTAHDRREESAKHLTHLELGRAIGLWS